MLERDLEKRLVKLVRDAGGVTYKLDSRSHKGAPDRVIALPDRQVFFLELKTDKGVVSPLQAFEHQKITRVGHKVIVTYGLDELKGVISAPA